MELDTIYNMDCIEGMKMLPEKSIDMILCDLPYGVTSRNKWDSQLPLVDLWQEYKRIIKDNGAILLFAQGMFAAKLMTSNSEMWRYNLIWEKTQPTGFLNAKRMPLRSHEDICVFYKKLPVYNPQKTTGHTRKVSSAEHKKNCKETTDYGKHSFISYDSTERYPLSILKIPQDEDTIVTFPKDTQKEALHPTQKPVALCEYLIKTYTNEGEVVLDNCFGSGTTLVAAVNTNRHVNDSVDTSVSYGAGDLLCSIAGKKPISGKLGDVGSKVQFETMANNIGSGWHLNTIKAESANQLLMIIELGRFNTQAAIGQGVVSCPINGSYNCSSYTGATEFEYHLIQYTKDEYIKLIDEKNVTLEEQLTDTQLALCDVYEMIGG